MYFDLVIFNFIYGATGHSKLLDFLGIFFADYVPYLLLACLLFLYFKKDRGMVFLAIGSGLVARFIVKTGILFFWQRPRPYIELPWIQKLIPMFSFDSFQSFPSGHALFFFAASTIVFLYHKKWGMGFLSASVLMGLARIFVGVHWPSDIVAGALLGIATALVIYFGYKKTPRF